MAVMLDPMTPKEEMQLLCAEQRADIVQRSAEAALRQAEDAAVVEDLDRVVTDPERALAELRAEPDDDRVPWRRAS